MMNSYQVPVHSTKTLIKASVAASALAVVVLVIAILPSEYNIDPTSIGKALGLTKLAKSAELLPVAEMASAPHAESSDTVNIEIPAGKGLEYKLLMEKYAHLEYEWVTDGEELYFDFHGEPRGDTTGYFESFSITTANNMKGSLTAPFPGSHGWYWKNKTHAPITVTLSIKGSYTIKP